MRRLSGSLACDPAPDLNEFDLTGDGVVDIVTAVPCPVSGGPGVVMFLDGATNEVILSFEGVAPGDQFGAAMIYIDDQNGDGLKEVLIGAPGAEASYLIRGPIRNYCYKDIYDADEADISILSPDDDVAEFGFALAQLYDFDDDGVSDLRIGGKYITAGGNVSARTYLVSGRTGRVIAKVQRTDDSVVSAISTTPGDTNRDAKVDSNDLITVVNNIGAQGNVDDTDGDVNADGVVDLADLVTTTYNEGVRYYDESDGSAPDGIDCSLDSAHALEWAYLIEREGAWLCVSSSLAGADLGPIINGSGSNWFTPNQTPCGQAVAACLSDPAVVAAAALIQARCFGDGNNSPLTVGNIFCGGCNNEDDNDGETGAKCNLFSGPRVDVYLCDYTDSDLCTTLAHELVHVSQACERGLFEGSCSDFWSIYLNKYHDMCGEVEAYKLAGQCDFDSTTNLPNCCERACDSSEDLWKCHADCVACCNGSGGTCCVGGRNQCLDNGSDPCGQ